MKPFLPVFAFIFCLSCTGSSALAQDSARFQIPDMVLVEGGTFTMGSGSGVPDETPAHQVRLSSFYIGRYEVNQREWREIMGNDPNVNYFPACDSCPVERVSWYAVQEFLGKLNARTGLRFRLPTEAEWEYAARGGKQSKHYRYSGSNRVLEVAWCDTNSEHRTHHIGTKKPNELGLYDMSGNVFEWCGDWYSPGYYPVTDYDDPQGPPGGVNRVIRGGSWFHDCSGLITTDRDKANPAFRFGYIGFRLCRSVE